MPAQYCRARPSTPWDFAAETSSCLSSFYQKAFVISCGMEAAHRTRTRLQSHQWVRFARSSLALAPTPTCARQAERAKEASHQCVRRLVRSAHVGARFNPTI